MKDVKNINIIFVVVIIIIFQCYLDATWIWEVSTDEWVNVGEENRKQIKKTQTTFNDYDAIFVVEAIRWENNATLVM